MLHREKLHPINPQQSFISAVYFHHMRGETSLCEVNWHLLENDCQYFSLFLVFFSTHFFESEKKFLV